MALRNLCRLRLPIRSVNVIAQRISRNVLTCQSQPAAQILTKSHFVLSVRHYSDNVSYHRDLTPPEFDKVREKCYVVDVREPDELLEIPPVPGARNIPLGTLPEHVSELPEDNVIFYCRGGVRSLAAVGIAQNAGLHEPKHLEGGITAWIVYHQQKN